MAIMKFLNKLLIISFIFYITGCKTNDISPKEYIVKYSESFNSVISSLPAIKKNINYIEVKSLHKLALKNFLKSGSTLNDIKMTVDIAAKDKTYHTIWIASEYIVIYYFTAENQLAKKRINNTWDSEVNRLESILDQAPNVTWYGDSKELMLIQIFSHGKVCKQLAIDNPENIKIFSRFTGVREFFDFYIRLISEEKELSEYIDIYQNKPIQRSIYVPANLTDF